MLHSPIRAGRYVLDMDVSAETYQVGTERGEATSQNYKANGVICESTQWIRLRMSLPACDESPSLELESRTLRSIHNCLIFTTRNQTLSLSISLRNQPTLVLGSSLSRGKKSKKAPTTPFCCSSSNVKMSSPFSGAGPVFYAWNRGQGRQGLSHVPYALIGDRAAGVYSGDPRRGAQALLALGSWSERPEE